MHQIKCSEIWGGNRASDTDVCTSAVTASLFSVGAEGGKGGDIYYFSVCGSDVLTRIAIADVVGHGQAVSETSQWLYDSIASHMNSHDGDAVLEDVNKLAKNHGYGAITTAEVITFNKQNSRMYFTSAGHPPALVKRKGFEGWEKVLIKNPTGKNIPLGVLDDPNYDEQSIPLEAGDILFLYTDGVIEAPCKDGNLFGMDKLMDVLKKNGNHSLEDIKGAVLEELQNKGETSFEHDDVTFMSIKVT
jgi:sigma-B regulation protein RsbU (phosphoserine phosphatase)